MSEKDQTDPNQTTQPNDAEPSTAPPSQPDEPTSSDNTPIPKGSLKGAGLKYTEGDGVPSWAVGKTADEILKMTQTLYDGMLQGEGTQNAPNPQSTPSQPSQPHQNVPQPQPQAQNPQMNPNGGHPSPPDPDLIYTDKGEYQRQLEAWQRSQTQSAVQAASAPILKPLARMAREQSRSDPKFKDIWNRYAPEIDAAIKQNVPEQNRTDPDIWNQAAKLVAGEHWEELAQDRAEKVAATPSDSGTVGAGGVTDATNAGGSGLDAISRLFQDNHASIRKFKRLGKTADDIRRHATAMGHDHETYAEMLKNRASVQWTSSGTPKDETEAAHAAALSNA